MKSLLVTVAWLLAAASPPPSNDRLWVGPDFPLDDRPGRYLVSELPSIITHSGCRGVIRIEPHPDGFLDAECDVNRPIPNPPPPEPSPN